MSSSRIGDSAPADTAALVAGVAHEINNPITYVLANLAELQRSCGALGDTLSLYRRALREHAGTNAEARISDIESKLEQCGGLELASELLADATEGAQRIRDLVRDLLSLSRSGERATARLAIGDVLEQTLRLVARSLAARAELARDFRATHEIEGDRTRLGQVLLNLLQNAIDACASVPERAHCITVRTRDTSAGVRIEVEDTGPGVPEELSARIFAPFFTTRSQTSGTGLGLYISRRIVAEHGGTLELVQTPGQGALFRVELPGLV
jgi:two-component system NtrC family sensor kinase